MREQKKGNLVREINAVENDRLGSSMYLRPYQRDLEIISELSRVSGEKKSAIAQKLLRMSLRGRKFEFVDEHEELKKLDWLISNEKHKIAERDVFDARLERLEEHALEQEKTIKQTAENSHFTRIITAEIYCVSVICMSYLNQIFTKIIEYFSPVEIERKNSTDFANRNILGLVEHSVAELEQFGEHHKLELETFEPELLYLYTKIGAIRERLSKIHEQKTTEHKQ